MDKAGDLASERGIAQAMQAEMNIKVIEIKDAKDPDELIKKNPEGWRQAVVAAKPVMRYYFDKTFAKFNIKDFDGQRQSINILLPVISKFGSKIEQDFWLKKLSQEVDTNENLLRDEFNKIVERAEQKLKTPVFAVKSGDLPAAEMKDQKQSRESRLSELLLALGLKYPAHLEYIINHIAPEHLVGEDYKLFYKNLIIYYNKLIDFWTHEGGNFDLAINYQDLKNWLNNPDDLEQDDKNEANNRENNHKCASSLDRLVLLADKDFYDYTPEKARAEIIEWVGILKVNYLSVRRRQIIKQIVSAEKEALEPREKAEKLKTLMEEYKALTEEINSIGLK